MVPVLSITCVCGRLIIPVVLSTVVVTALLFRLLQIKKLRLRNSSITHYAQSWCSGLTYLKVPNLSVAKIYCTQRYTTHTYLKECGLYMRQL